MGLDSFVHWLLYSSLLGSGLVGLILVVRLVSKHRLGANWQYLIWFLLIAKLLIPFAPESPFSVFNVFNYVVTQSADYFKPSESVAVEPTVNRKFSIDKLANNSGDYYVSVDRAFFDNENEMIFLVWLIGVVIFTCYMIRSTMKLQAIIKNSPQVRDKDVLKLLIECKKVVKVRHNPILVESEAFQSPRIVGVVQPHLVLPIGMVQFLSKMDLRYIFLHELAHLQRKDLYVNWIIAFFQIIHWFNPLIWYAFYQMRQDRELACDASVLSLLEPEECHHYGVAIIAFLERYSYQGDSFTTAGFISSKKHIKDRLSRIAFYQKRTMTKLILEVFFFLLFSGFVLTSASDVSGTASFVEPPQGKQSIVYKDLSRYFQGYNGAFVLLDLEKDHYLIYHDNNNNEKVSPDSTYKIISSLIGLETGVLTKDNTLLAWDGTLFPIEQWNRDQTLKSAMRYSVNWYFQRVDSSVGKARLENYLKQTGYGNHDLSGGIKDFWIESSLKISPKEQVEILKKLCTYDMPFSPENIDIVKNAIKLSEQDHLVLYGKTGTGNVNGKNINGWFIGFVKNGGRTYIFATNIQGNEAVDGANAKNITLAILKDENIL
ncbi:MAG: BlaR1 family beta-lactam sensor/signal transducer [Sporomusaceae bacterium]|nr:BlaR1 family beta-lactam sensor/signal transducer [Sporomusaceae bacterium]